MALIVLEGLDRTGKTTVAKYYENMGYSCLHMSAPQKGTLPEHYMQEMVDVVTSSATKDLILDRSYYGELIWSSVYNRNPLLTEEDINYLREIEDTVGVQRILMIDPNVEAHWKRCVDNNEPLDKAQFIKARALYSQMAQKFNFEVLSLPQFYKKFPDAGSLETQEKITEIKDIHVEQKTIKTPEQLKLEKANAINEILSKRILKQKGDLYEDLERDIRDFLNSKLGRLFGSKDDFGLTQEEIKFYKTMYKKAIQKGDK